MSLFIYTFKRRRYTEGYVMYTHTFYTPSVFYNTLSVCLLSDTNTCMRLCCGPQRGFTIHILDNSNQVRRLPLIWF